MHDHQSITSSKSLFICSALKYIAKHNYSGSLFGVVTVTTVLLVIVFVIISFVCIFCIYIC